LLVGTTTSEGTVTVSGDASASQLTALALKQDTTSDQGSSMTCDLDFYLWDNNTRISTPQARIGIVGDDTLDQNYEAGGQLCFYTNIRSATSPNLTERLRISSDGGVGIGQTSPYSNASYTSLSLGGTSGKAGLTEYKYSNNVPKGYLYAQSDGVALESVSTNIIRFVTNGAERMRLDSAGRLLLGTTSPAIGSIGNANNLAVLGGTNATVPMVVFADPDFSVEAGGVLLELSFQGDSSFAEANYVLFSDSSGTQGSISGTGNQTVSFNTSSDRRLKENIVDTGSQLEKIKQIEVRDFNYIGNDITTTGMIAQELNEIIPNVVVEGLEDFKRHPWGIDYGKLTPYLIKAIQEQQEQIEALQSEINLLKGE